MPSPTPEQMAFAKQLQQEFRGRGSSRGGSSLRGRGNGPITAGPRSERQAYPPVRSNAMVRPMPAANHAGFQRPMPPAADVQRAPIKINKDLSDWVDGGKPSKPVNPEPSASAPAVSQPAVDSQPPHLARKAAVVAQAPATTHTVNSTKETVAPKTSHSIVAGAPEPSAAYHQPEAPVKQKPDGQDKSEAYSTHNGLHQSIWAGQGQAPEAETVKAATNKTDTNEVHLFQVTTENHATKDAVSIDRAITATPTDKIQKNDSLAGQASRLLADTAPTSSNNASGSATSTISASAHNEPGFSLADWALQILRAGKVLPPKEQTAAQLSKIKQPEKETAPHSSKGIQPEKAAAAHWSNGERADSESPTTMDMHTKICNCPKRIRPLAGLSASQFNNDADGDRQIAGLSETARRKFAVNVIKFDHPLEDCPILLKAQAEFPLSFGAIPATLDEQEDNLDVIPYQANEAEAPGKAQKVSGLGRGLNASIWA
ncbi:hypothetical protein CkaCkLH20_08427 [Colletotrichum karsti]|uniref:Uncharacterized protein n=1 Tax=Colletotrichum karsti TaxID=1095194 RepID=A0A9P6I1E6_9PEZI|nr:uncharacterized protein CkaCkLH20_08427 [Colletotrichum karsti]KAF9874055.1 hypothetical protein CkaCkLH20_08427 [Colletotrichum karsti]